MLATLKFKCIPQHNQLRYVTVSATFTNKASTATLSWPSYFINVALSWDVPIDIFAFKMGFSATARPIDEKRQTIGGTPHREYFIDNPDLRGHMIWLPYWIKVKILDIILSETAQWKKVETWHTSSAPHWVYKVITMTSLVKWYSSHNWLNLNPYPKNLKLHISDLRPDASEELNLCHRSRGLVAIFDWK